ncbi:hypothetical protein [Legionella sp.]|uniref:hypothetical protein n=1 Tax=Legionella sp. TaxID=459 RepID=UPI003D10790B
MQYDEHHPDIGANITDVEMVRYLMELHNLHQKDLADIFGSQANVSKFLNGERHLGSSKSICILLLVHLQNNSSRAESVFKH